VDLRDTVEEAAFRQEVREFIAHNLPAASKQRGGRRFEDADREWSRRLGEAGRARVLEMFTWERAAQATVAEYEKAIAAC